MRLLRPIIHVCLWVGAASGVFAAGSAEDLQRLRTRSLAATCSQCHGTDGRPAAGSIVPALAGRSEADTTQQLLAFKAGSRPATVMTQLAKGYSDEQIRQLAAYFAAQK
ncbi:MAG: c-type cytochrome [Caldimonas sp.]